MHMYYPSRDLFVSDLSVTPFVLFCLPVFDGIPRSQDQIHATSGALLGEAEKEGNPSTLMLMAVACKNEVEEREKMGCLFEIHSFDCIWYILVMLLLLLALIESGETLTIIAKVNICSKLFLLDLRGGGVDVVCSYFLLRLSLLSFFPPAAPSHHFTLPLLVPVSPCRKVTHIRKV